MSRDNVRKKSNIASIVELFLMFLLLLVVIVVITMVCMTAREQSLHASDLTDAVICAENTAEITHDAADAREAAELMKFMDGVSNIKVSGDTVTASSDGFDIEIVLAPDEGTAGTYVDETINIYNGSDAALYQLHTGNFIDTGGAQ